MGAVRLLTPQLATAMPPFCVRDGSVREMTSCQQSIPVSADKIYVKTYPRGARSVRLELVRHTVKCNPVDVFFPLRKTAHLIRTK